ncbi:uncharacterized protein TNCV_2509901 [Trichonephila clavipes]|nr:uncharacterized protein TNCV_2509901 [Trichonephila clavipes]
MSVKTVEKRRKRSLPLHLMLRKGRNKAWITSDEAQFHLSFPTGKTKIQYISSKKRRKDATVLKNASWPSGVMVWTETSSQSLSKQFFVEPNFKIDAKYYQNKVLKHLIKKSGDRFNSCQVIYSQFGLAIHQNDHQAKRRFVEWAQNEIVVVPDFHKRILFSDEAHFWLNSYVIKQNCRIWSEANPQVYVETPLHPEN